MIIFSVNKKEQVRRLSAILDTGVKFVNTLQPVSQTIIALLHAKTNI